MKTRTHGFLASLVTAVALTHPAANAADDRLWREQIPASPPMLLTLDAASTRATLASDDWLWRAQVPAPATTSLYITFTTVDAGPPAHALWREQIRRQVRHSPPDVAQSSARSDD